MKIFYFLVSIALSMVSMNVYAGFSPGCNDNILAIAPDERYTNNNDGTVTDKWTGLMWKKCAEGLSEDVDGACTAGTMETRDWRGALDYPASVNTGSGFAGYKDWRLPNIKELLSMIERKCHAPAVNSNFFSVTVDMGTPFWSSTAGESLGTGISLNLIDGTITQSEIVSSFPIRMVRDAQ